MLRSYTGKVAVVTGAASGLGLALARELARRKCHLALVDIDGEKLAAAESSLASADIRISGHTADVASAETMRDLAQRVSAEHGAAHLLINNAGIGISAPLSATSPDAFDRLMRVNFDGVLNGCRAFLPLLQQQPEAQIVNVSSCFAWLGYPGKSAYSASKAAVRAFSEALRMELAETAVGVTVLYPGIVATSIVSHGVAVSPDLRDREAAFLAQRGRNPDDAARLALDRLAGNPHRILIGSEYRLLDALTRFSPGLAARIVRWGAKRQGF